MTTISLKLPDTLLRRVEDEAQARQTTKSSLIRDVLEKALEPTSAKRDGSCFDLARDLAGSVKGMPKDLATNPRHMEGFGR